MQKTKLSLAATTESYKDQCYEIYLKDENYNKFVYSAPKEREEFNKKFEDSEQNPCFVLVGAKDEVIGFCGVEVTGFDRYAEINYMIKPKYQNQGYGKKLLDKIIEQMKVFKSADYLEATTNNNPISEKLLLSVGFIKVGTFPNYRRVIINGEYQTLDETSYYLKLN